jgi:hypothetical protein
MDSAAPRMIHALPLQDTSQVPEKTASPTPDEVVSILDSKLSLSDDQKTKITPIVADRQQKIKALKADTSLRPMQRMRKAKEILSDSDKKINTVLTPDQQKKYAEVEQQMQEQMKQRMQQRKSGASN